MRLTRALLQSALDAPLDSAWGAARDAQPAAVVVPVVLAADGAAEDESHVIAILRSASLREHSGEVAFPGGKVDPTDRDLCATAFRELREEVGVDEGSVEHLGRLSPVRVVTGKYVIHPFVAEVVGGAGPFIASPEIARILRVPLVPYLTGATRFSAVKAPWRGGEATIPHFDLEGCVLYGASAFVFYELLTKLARALGTTLPSGVLTATYPWGERYAR